MRHARTYLLVGALLVENLLPAQGLIDRHALVSRHNVTNEKADPLSALSLGNGRFAFTVDVTGLQSFPEYYEKGISLGTQSEWGWHSFTDTAHLHLEEAMKEYTIHGRKIKYAVQRKEPVRSRLAADWFRENPHRLQLGNLGFELIRKDGSFATMEDLRNIHQTLDLWKGIILSSFTLEGIPVYVKTIVHPDQDLVAVSIRSELMELGRLHIRLRFPYPTGAFTDVGDNWSQEDKHSSRIVQNSSTASTIGHLLDTTQYFVGLRWTGKGACRKSSLQSFLLTPGTVDSFSFSCRWSRKLVSSGSLPTFLTADLANKVAWEHFWSTGGAVDFSGSTDPRASELERRVVLSQYLTRIQCAGDEPPQETGLTYNSWYGKPHLEMHWWHAAHFALWGRTDLLERSLNWYSKVATTARGIAERQGYRGVRWQKMTDPEGRETPSSVGAFLIWQQPHFIYLAELCYRQQKNAKDRRAILDRYKDLVFATADFMASYSWYDEATHRYILGNGLIPAQERFAAATTVNPCFELAYWRWALSMAQHWRARMDQPFDKGWRDVENKLSLLPQHDGLYYPTESDTDAYTRPSYRTDHPVVLATYGFLPATRGLDTAVMLHTFDWVWKNWSWEDTWGWDFSLAAMSATRLGLPDKAIDALLMPVTKNRYLSNGNNYQDERLRLYLPGNGGLLSAIALMCAGYDGCEEPNPGIPKDGKWTVRWEGLAKMP